MDNNFNNNGFNGYQTDPYKQGSDASAQNVNTDKADGSQNTAQQSNYNPYSGYNYGQTDMYGNNQPNAYSQSAQNNAAGNAYTQGAQNPAGGRRKKEKKKGGFGAFMGRTVAAALVFGLVGGGIFTGVSYVGTRSLHAQGTSKATLSTTTDSKNSGSATTTSASADSSADVSSIVKNVMPSIVAITNTGTVSYNTFFGEQSQQSESAGSGIIVSEDDDYLYISTNNHVVANAEQLTVQFCDNEVVAAEVRGTDPDDDLAVVRVKKSDIKSDTMSAIKKATIGDSDSVSVGNEAIAIGNALGYGQTVTTGIVSALDRTVTTQDSTTGETTTNSHLIQTDAAINPGNSGGALLNASGEVIGINSVKYSSTEVEGIGYAIPMSVAQPIIESLIQNGSYTNENAAYLGIKGGDVSSEMIAYGFPAGVYVSSVINGSGAQAAGISEGDIITEVDGTKITGMSDLKAALKSYSAGDKVTFTVARQNGNKYETSSVDVTLSAASQLQDDTSSESNSGSDSNGNNGSNGYNDNGNGNGFNPFGN